MTPPRLCELACPHRDRRLWTIDCAFRGIDGVRTAFDAAAYPCARPPPAWSRVAAPAGVSTRAARACASSDDEYIARWRLPSGDDAVLRVGLTIDAAYGIARLYLDPRTTPLPGSTDVR